MIAGHERAPRSARLTRGPGLHRRASRPGQVRAATHVCRRRGSPTCGVARRARSDDRAATFDFVLESGRRSSSTRRPGSAAPWPTTPTRPISCQSLQIRSACWMPWRRSAGCCSWARRASARLARNRSRKRCSPVGRPTTYAIAKIAILAGGAPAWPAVDLGDARQPVPGRGDATFMRPARICCRHSSAAMTAPRDQLGHRHAPTVAHVDDTIICWNISTGRPMST